MADPAWGMAQVAVDTLAVGTVAEGMAEWVPVRTLELAEDKAVVVETDTVVAAVALTDGHRLTEEK